jgi:isocitrate/isopropylmalate dehydrogenase
MKTLAIGAIPGDGIGKQVSSEGARILQAASRRFTFMLNYFRPNRSCMNSMKRCVFAGKSRVSVMA